MSGSGFIKNSTATVGKLSSWTEHNEVTKQQYVIPFSDAWVIISTSIIAALFLFGVTANAVTVAVIQSSAKLKNRYYTFLQSICLSDIVSAFVSILFLYRRTWGFDYFALPDVFCRLYWGLDLWTSFSTSLHILSFAILRLIGVRWPIQFKNITPLLMKVWIASIWTVTFFGGFIPHFLFNTAKVIDRTNEPHNSRWASCSLSTYWFATWQVYVQYAYAFFLYLPAISILGISVIITFLLKKQSALPGTASKLHPSSSTDQSKTDNDQNDVNSVSSNVYKQKKKKRNSASQRRWKKDRQAIYQLFLIVASFLLGYIPLTAFHFHTGFTMDESGPEINRFDWKFAMIQYLLLRFSECLNPIFYNVASRKMRIETIGFLKRRCCLKQQNRVVSHATSTTRITSTPM